MQKLNTTIMVFVTVIVGMSCIDQSGRPTASVKVRSKFDMQPTLVEKQLPQGKEVGTFRYSFNGNVTFARKPEPWTTIVIEDESGKPIVEQRTKDDLSFHIEAELPPGKYSVQSEVPGGFDHVTYWGSSIGRINISETGELNQSTPPFIHKLKMRLLEPTNSVVVSSKRPILKWKPLDGATEYRVGWFEKTLGGNRQVIKTEQGMTTTKSEYQIEEDLVPQRMYAWFIGAINEDGAQFGYYSSGYFETSEKLK
ncbi:hypothetical protein Pan258_07400 [Symmachiella dynata]|uniref:hypothetical protein n=1 Tax=Symmachiella dynata TaxID=2527995 RepID=UPI00118B68BB|nr:hypothetical protein [Symmachiella dynata]QDT46721.1 hypothetical protein Pan258_07400 [Symmachiella dynata]